MNSELNEVKTDAEAKDENEFADDDFVDTVVLPDADATDNVGDASVEINVEELIADIEGSDDEVSLRKREARRRLEELAEEQSFEDTYAIDFDKV